MSDMTTIRKSLLNRRDEIIRKISQEVNKTQPNHSYHNFEHTLNVVSAVREYSSGLDQYEALLLEIAAWFHDVIFVPKDDNNEINSANHASTFLKILGFPETDIELVKAIIISTTIHFNDKGAHTTPKTLLEEMMCDADLDYLGTDEFFEIGSKLRKEWGITDDKKWWELQEKFLESHKYHSSIARKLRDHKKKQNLEKVKEILANLK